MVKRHQYTQEEKDYIRDICEGKLLEDIQKMFNQRFSTNVTTGSIRGIMCRNGFKSGTGNNGQFKKGNKLANKQGNKGTWYQKGETHPRHRPVGSEIINRGVVRIKTAEPNEWQPKHRYIWEEANGPVPEGMIIRFKDGDKMNVTLENLFMTPFRVMSSVVHRKIESDHPELNVTTHRLAELELKIKDVGVNR